MGEKDINTEFNLSIDYIGIELRDIWYKLSYREKTIIIALLNKPLKRIEISEKIRVTSGSLNPYLNNLQNLELIEFENNEYRISETMLEKWLKIEYEKKGNYPL